MSLANKKVLVIDDTEAIRTFLRISLHAHGAEVFEAANGREGLKMYEEIQPDLVVLDLGLPDRDGLEVLADIKKKANGSPGSVVVLTVRKDQPVISRAYALGADAYMTKPFLMEDLLEVIDGQMRRPASAFVS